MDVSERASQIMSQKAPEFWDGLDFMESGDYGKALVCFLRCSKRGDVDAMQFCGEIYAGGLGVAKNIPAAVEFWQMAADADDVKSMFNLGKLCFFGDGVDQDFADARTWFARGATHGDAGSIFYLGVIVSQGLGMERDIEAGRKLLMVASADDSEYGRQAKAALDGLDK